ncbi:insulinase family protein, partial [uncultured Sphingomonas sp.]|uniref:M16 family metallopeptidase n=1 Tax=uncultured Sphingomonas sp. TaxID=158754 RepID=UPI0025F96E74
MSLRMMLMAGTALILAPVPAFAGRPANAATTTASRPDTTPAELVKLVRDFTIPYQTFTLPNGLTVIVLTDHSVPIVYTSINYAVCSTFEPAGRSGFAHLFEHLMFNGSENAPGDYFKYLRDAGSIGVNGSTGYDFT